MVVLVYSDFRAYAPYLSQDAAPTKGASKPNSAEGCPLALRGFAQSATREKPITASPAFG
eukprot:CAMPEP_0171104138 /NCGR_PEP_ID=MMETSP0766_2-20121228/60082_1 /TAXON_ID=439317 /ORGANISM="Gambierdiscus australes, Strain CAWD 149" /LENGTH=59 /DNA_ID=CAMNT_0011564713 /DNA_START=14 /DNA_END=191 /DNA_ORIENTATION=+